MPKGPSGQKPAPPKPKATKTRPADPISRAVSIMQQATGEKPKKGLVTVIAAVGGDGKLSERSRKLLLRHLGGDVGRGPLASRIAFGMLPISSS